MPKWLAALEQIGPIVLAFTPLAPIAPAVVGGIQLAESLKGASGAQKKAIVQQIAVTAAQGANAQAGKTVIDPDLVSSTSSAVIDAVVQSVNLVKQTPPDQAVEQTAA